MPRQRTTPGRLPPFAFNLREARLRAGKSQQEMANVIGIHRPQYTEIELGGRHLRIQEAYLAARHLGLNIDDLCRNNSAASKAA